MQTVIIFGGSGFVGRSLISKLLKQNFRVKIISRDYEKSSYLKTFAGPDILSIQAWNYHDFSKLDEIFTRDSIVINLVGLLAEEKKGDFKKYHTNLAEKIAKKCAEFNVKFFVQLSALAIEKSKTSKYALSKLEGEKLIIKNFPQATILRPSVIFGENDNFFNKFRNMIKFSQFVPLIDNGKTNFQPIYVEDLTDIICKAISNNFYQGKIYEIGGDKIYSLKHLFELVGSYLDKEIRFNNLPLYQAKILAFFLEIFTKKILTRDQIELLKTDNILSDNSFKKDFNINPKSVEEIVPNYII
ncbi:MAG: complex I NDUFA9 subunit family protein [Rickettsiales bacterium]|nr:complex I NDUFA9 subunit family protein [Rickettsiales bacterium]